MLGDCSPALSLLSRTRLFCEGCDSLLSVFRRPTRAAWHPLTDFAADRFGGALLLRQFRNLSSQRHDFRAEHCDFSSISFVRGGHRRGEFFVHVEQEFIGEIGGVLTDFVLARATHEDTDTLSTPRCRRQKAAVGIAYQCGTPRASTRTSMPSTTAPGARSIPSARPARPGPTATRLYNPALRLEMMKLPSSATTAPPSNDGS